MKFKYMYDSDDSNDNKESVIEINWIKSEKFSDVLSRNHKCYKYIGNTFGSTYRTIIIFS